MTSSIFGGSVVVIPFFRLIGDSRNLRSTPCGTDRGALPIRDRDLDVLEKDLDGCGEHRAGTRKSGSKIKAFVDLARR